MPSQPLRLSVNKEFSICDASHIWSARMHLFSSREDWLGRDVMLRDTNRRPRPTRWTSEPSLSELLSDPIAQALMLADGVKCHHLTALFAKVPSRQQPAIRVASPPG